MSPRRGLLIIGALALATLLWWGSTEDPAPAHGEHVSAERSDPPSGPSAGTDDPLLANRREADELRESASVAAEALGGEDETWSPWIRGRTVDRAGRGLAGVEVVALPAELGNVIDRGRILAEARCRGLSGDDGEFALQVERPGRSVLFGHRPGWSSDSVLVERGPGLGPHRLTLCLEPGEHLHGIVLDQSGRAIANAEVECRSSTQTHQLSLSTRTTPEGRFDFEGLPSRHAMLLVGADGHVPAHRWLMPDESPAEFVLKPAAIVHGRVTTESSGRGVSGLEVQVTSAMFPSSSRATTDEDGHYRITTAPTGDTLYGMVAALGDTPWLPAPRAEQWDVVDVTELAGPFDPGREFRMDFVVRPSFEGFGEVQGRVVEGPGGPPISGALVLAQARGATRLSARSDRQGRFTLGGLPVGTFSLGVLSERHSALVRSMELPKDGTLDVGELALDRGARIEGRVVDSEGRGVSRASVLLHVPDPVALRFFELHDSSEASALLRQLSDEEGHFHFDHLEPGQRLELRVRHADFADGPPFELRVPDDTGPELRLVVHRGFDLRGQLLRPDGSLGAGLQVQWREAARPGQNYTWTGSRRAPTDAEGRFFFERLAQGGDLLVRESTGAGSLEWFLPLDVARLVAPEGESISRSFQLVATRRIGGRLVDGRGTPLTDHTVHSSDSLDGTSAPQSRASVVDADGRFELRGLGIGRRRLQVRGPEGLVRAEREVETGTLDLEWVLGVNSPRP